MDEYTERMETPDTPSTLASLRKLSSQARRRSGPGPSSNLSLFDFPGVEDGSAAGPPSPGEPGVSQRPTGQPSLTRNPAPSPPPVDIPEVPESIVSPNSVSVPRPQTWSVSGLVRHVRGLVEESYGRVTVEGEVSNWRPAGSGHCYFTIKDADAQLSAVMFRRQAALLRFQPADGDAVKLHGQLSLYENRGQMQLIVEWMQQAGLGALLAEVQRLKDRLRQEGLFDRKRPLPQFPRCIGVITSLHGAALRDIIKVCRRRHAAVRILIYPAAVQGPACPAEISAGLRWFNAHPDQAEVLLVSRGGGSWEDLHGFDHEDVVRAIANSALPVITGLGHATDSTLADAAADLCAPTPSAAAEILTAAQHRIEDGLAGLLQRLLRANRYEMLHARQRLAKVDAASVAHRVERALNSRAQRLDELQYRAQAAFQQRFRSRTNRLRLDESRLARLSPAVRLQNNQRRLGDLQSRLHRLGRSRIDTLRRRRDTAHTRLEALSPLRVLGRGYALVYGPEGRLLRSTLGIEPGAQLQARLAEGTLRAQVLATATELEGNPDAI